MQQPPERVRIMLEDKPKGDWWKCESADGSWFAATTADLKEIEPVFILSDQASDPNGRTIEHLVYQALYIHKLEIRRVLRAVVIMSQPKLIRPHGEVYFVQSAPFKQAYTVSKGSCNCEDSKAGNVCKHRIAAAWTRAQAAPKPEIYEYAYCLECMEKHWLLDGETCKGKNFDPRQIPNTRIKTSLANTAHTHATIEVLVKS
jgi:hypothetical protein